MTTQHKLISEISPGQYNWTAKVIVAEKSSPKIAHSSPTKYQHLWLIDPSNNKVHATLYDNNITAFQDTLLPLKTYLISNAVVKFTKEQYKAFFGDIQWTINGRTRVEEIHEDYNTLVAATYNFLAFDDLQQHMDSESEISYIGVAIDLRPRRQIQNRNGTESIIQEVVLINERLQAILLRMWDNFVEHECIEISNLLTKRPIIAGKHLRVTSFNGLSISTKMNSSISINANFERAAEIKSWMDANSDMLNSIVMKKSYMLPTSAIISCPPGDKFTKINEIQELLLMQKNFWIKATLSLKWTKQPVWYMACSNCNKISAAQYNEVYLCVFCKYPHSRAIPRGRATVELRDNTGSITATVIGEAAEKFFDCCAEELMHQDTMEDRPNNIPVFRTHIEDEHVIYVKSANRATIPNQTLFDVIFILDPDTVIKETEALEFLSTNKQSSSLSISTIPGEQEGNNSSVRRVLFGASSEPQEKKKQKQEESMHPDNDITTFNSDDVDKNNYSFSDGTSSASK